MCTISQHQQSGVFRSGWYCFLRTVVGPSDEVGTAFANEIMSTIPADDRCRIVLFALAPAPFLSPYDKFLDPFMLMMTNVWTGDNPTLDADNWV